jgi:hypothetical protein
MGATDGFFSRFSGGLARIRKHILWIYCSAILFPLAFAGIAAVFLTVRNRAHLDLGFAKGMFAAFYLILMSLLASVPRSVLPALILWMLIAHFRPGYDREKPARYLGLAALLAAALFVHAKIYAQSFNFLWMTIAYMAVALPRLALPSLRDGLKDA